MNRIIKGCVLGLIACGSFELGTVYGVGLCLGTLDAFGDTKARIVRLSLNRTHKKRMKMVSGVAKFIKQRIEKEL